MSSNPDVLRWRRSTQCVLPDGDCVEVARRDGRVHVRDSKDPAGAVLTFNDREWRSFVAGVLAGEFS